MERIIEYIAKFDGSAEENLKAYGFSSRVCTALKREFGLLKANGKPIFVVDRVSAGDVMTLTIRETPRHIDKYERDIAIVCEDEDVAVIDKPPDLAAVSTSAHYGKSLMNALACKWGDFVYHPVTRLDKGTSGLMLIAKHGLAHSLLNAELKEGDGKKVKREYLALVEGFPGESGVIDAPIAHPDLSGYRREVDESGKRAVTYYEAVERYGGFTLLRLKLATGRTHQIRVHMSYIGCPLVGDALYGGGTELMRPALHSAHIEFTQPITGEKMSFSSPLPPDIAEFIADLSKSW